MHVALPPKRMTFEEFMAIPYDGVRRWLNDGVLREENGSVTNRNRVHSIITARISRLLCNWLDTQPEPRGEILCGEAGIRLREEPAWTVGADVAYVSAEVMSRQTAEVTIVVGVPVLAVEILSPSTTQEDIHEKTRLYREAGTPLVWVIDPGDRTVRIYRAGEEPALVNLRQELDGGALLPGFRVPVARLFP